MSRDLRLFGL